MSMSVSAIWTGSSCGRTRKGNIRGTAGVRTRGCPKRLAPKSPPSGRPVRCWTISARATRPHAAHEACGRVALAEMVQHLTGRPEGGDFGANLFGQPLVRTPAVPRIFPFRVLPHDDPVQIADTDIDQWRSAPRYRHRAPGTKDDKNSASPPSSCP